jgi:class 3 adenylate cyclase
LEIRRAAEALRGDMPQPFRLRFRIGVHTGPAVLGLIGPESRIEYTAIGDSVNTAKRLQENAASGQILLSRPAIEPILHLVEAERAQPIQAQGKREAIEVWELRGMRSPITG